MCCLRVIKLLSLICLIRLTALAVVASHIDDRLAADNKDQDLTEEQDEIVITVKTTSGENESLMLTETLTHSGLFTGSFPLIARSEPRSNSGDNRVECC